MSSASSATVDVAITDAVSGFAQTELATQVASVRGIILVQDDATCTEAKNRIAALKSLKKKVELWWEPITSNMYKAWKAATSKRGEFLNPIDDEIKDQSSEVRRYESIRPALAMPFDSAEAPKVEALQEREGVAQVRVTSLRAVLTVALESEQVYAWLSDALTGAISSCLASKAREMGDELAKIVPGIEVYRDKVYAQAPAKKTEAIAINRVPVEGSSQIASAGYKSGILEVQFKKKDGAPGDIWNYHDVPANIYMDFLLSDSKGKFLNAEVKGKYEAKKSAA